MIFNYTEKLHKLFLNGVYDGVKFTDIQKRENSFGVRTKELKTALSELERRGKVKFSDGRYFADEREKTAFERKRRENAEVITGVIRTNERGFGFITVQGDKDYFVAPENLCGALNGDTVAAYTIVGRGTNDSARVAKVIERGKTKLVGVVFTEGAFTYVRPDDKCYLCDIFIPDRNVNGATNGDKVYLSLTAFPKGRCPEGKIEAVIGKSFTLDAEEKAIVLDCGIEEDFPPEAIAQAISVPQKVADNAIIGRLDLENETIFTIDGDTAKDFDDAVSLTKTLDGNYLLGVHIADVSEYVTESSPLDKAAFERGTSVYFPDKVVPMLPFELSNGICSLVEGERRLTISVFCEINGKGEIVKSDIAKSFIRSKKRLTYNQVDGLFDGELPASEMGGEIADTLFSMRELSNILKAKRAKEGYVDLDIKESEINIVDGKITVKTHAVTEATSLIEQFMITANETVAQYLFYSGLPCVYRIHEKPLPEKLRFLTEFIAALGLKFNLRRDEVFPSDIRKLLDGVRGKDCYAVVNKVVLRSLQKAKYSTENLGHFGLASKCYCHFTSPIRRYPDLLVHRALSSALGGNIMEKIDLYEDFFVGAADHSSAKERSAETAERAVDDLYKAKYLESEIGNTFYGVISGVKSEGVFVEFDNGCEVFCPTEFFPRGAYEYDRDAFSIVSGKYRFTIGKRVGVVILGVDLGDRKAQAALTDVKSCRRK